MRATCQSYSPQNSYISGTATKHKDVNTLKVNSRTNHFNCFAHLWRWLDVSVKAKVPVKMWNVTFEATYHTTVWGKFIYFIERLFYLQPQIFSTSTIGFNEFLLTNRTVLEKWRVFYIVLHPQLWGFGAWLQLMMIHLLLIPVSHRMQRHCETSSDLRKRKTLSDQIHN